MANPDSDLPPYDPQRILSAPFPERVRLVCRSWVVWYYTFGVNCTRKFSRSHTHLFHFVKDEKDFTFNGDAIRVPSARQLVYGDGRANPVGRLPDDTHYLCHLAMGEQGDHRE